MIVAGASARAQSPTLEDLRKMIEQQQRVIEELQRKVEALQESARAKEGTVAPAAEPVVSAAEPRVTLSISGHINRAVNIADDGDTTEAYFVDNENSVSRVRLTGSGEVSDDVTLGTQIELGIAPNSAADVSQVNEESGDKLEKAPASISRKRRLCRRFRASRHHSSTVRPALTRGASRRKPLRPVAGLPDNRRTFRSSRRGTACLGRTMG